MITLVKASKICKEHGFGSLITEPQGNSKLAKSEGWYNAGISLAQASLSGYNMCRASTPQCRASCLGGTGRAEFTPTIEKVRIARTRFMVEYPKLFWQVLEAELHKVDRKAKRLGVSVAFRPNILSDQQWHKLFPQMFDIFSHWQFYSYTKVKAKVRQAIDRQLPDNYHVTYSWSERASISQVKSYVKSGINVAVPFYDKNTLRPIIPEQWKGLEVINGDKSDLRFLDPSNVIVGLSVKLPKKRTKAINRIKQAKGFFVGV